MSAEIKEQLDRIESALIAISAMVMTMHDRPVTVPTSAPVPSPSPYAPPPTGSVADAGELDSQYGNPEVRRDPPRWKGETFKGKKYSACPADFLDVLAGFLDWQAGKDDEKGTDDGKKYAGYARKDAARARGWAQRKRDGWKPVGPGAGADDDVPFMRLD